MSRLIWDNTGERFYETGTDHGVLFKKNSDGTYAKGVNWNGLSGVSDSPSGAEASPVWADNIKYINLMSNEEFGATITAYQSPAEFDECDGTVSPIAGMRVRQQSRKEFGFSWRTKIGNDTDGSDHGYVIHVAYNCIASPSEKSYQTINDSPEAMELSWELSTTPVDIPGMKPSAKIEFDSTLLTAAQMKIVEDTLWGTENSDPRLPSPSEWIALLGGEPQPEIVLNRSTVSMGVGESVTIGAQVVPEGTAVTWSSSSTSVATVADGVVTGVDAGTAVITASITVSGTSYTDTCTAIITAAEG